MHSRRIPRATTRRSLLIGSGAACIASVLSSHHAHADVASSNAGSAPTPTARTYEKLFHIERSKNANIVQYDAVLDAVRSKLLPETPVVAYWVLLAEDGRREGLNALERRAYGFKVVPEQQPNGSSKDEAAAATAQPTSWLLYLGATPNRTIRIMSWKQEWVAQTLIAGKNARLTRLYVMTDESALFPRVRWVDVFGTDLTTGAAVTERLKP